MSASGVVFSSVGAPCVATRGTGVGVGLLKNLPSMLGRGVAETTGAGVAAGTGVTTGSVAAVADFLCDRLLLAGDAAEEAVAAAGAGDDSAALAVSFRL
jgi:hypothetical protein